MKKLLVALVTTSCLLSLSAHATVQDNTTVATYKNGEAKASQVMNFVSERAPQLKDKKLSEFNPSVQSALIKEYVYSQIIPVESKSSGLESSKSFQEKLAVAKLELIRQEILNDYIQKHYKDDMIDKEYDTLAANLKGKDEIKAWQILVPTKERADAIAAQMRAPKANFVQIAEGLLKKERDRISKATDPKDQAPRIAGGPLGYFIPGQTPQDFDQQIFKFKKNDIAVITTSAGHHIVKIEDKRKVKVPTKAEVREALKQQIENNLMLDYYKSIDDKYNIKVTVENFEPAANAAAAPSK